MRAILKYDYLLLMLSVAMMPLAMKYVVWVLTPFIILQIVRYSIERNKISLSKSDLQLMLPFAVFYLVHMIGIIWTDDVSQGLFNLQVKLSFIALPLVFWYLSAIKWEHFQKVMWSIVIGVTSASIVFILRATYIYLVEDDWIQHFFGSRLCFTMHVGYFGILVNLAAIIVFFNLYHNWTTKSIRSKFLSIFLSVFLFIILILTSAKNPILTYLVISLFIIIWLVLFTKPIIGILGLLVMLVFFIVILRFSEKTYLRFQALIDSVQSSTEIIKVSEESSQVRLVAWKTSIEMIRRNPLIGTGTGDDDKEMFDYFETHGYTGALTKRMNSHNQYLESTVKLGILGLAALLYLTFSQLILGIRTKNLLLTFTVLLFILSSLTESVFEVQAGVIPYCLFVSVIVFSKLDNIHDPIFTTKNSSGGTFGN